MASTTYQGPNVSVRQEFVTSPGAVAIESLPSVAVATAYDVFKKKSLGSTYGIKPTRILPWGTTNKVIYSKDQAGLKVLNMYPPKAYANSQFGVLDLDVPAGDISEDGMSLDVDDMYIVPGTEKVAGSCQAIIPYYQAHLETKIFETDLRTVVVTNGSVVTAQIKPGQKVFIKITSTWTLVGTVGSVGTDETKITLAAPYTAAVTNGTDIAVGAANSDFIDIPNTLYDSSANFVSAKVAVGDIISVSSLAISGSVENPILATVIAIINKNTLRFNTDTATSDQDVNPGKIDYNFLTYKTFTNAIGTTAQVYSYSINRLLGFSQSYGVKFLNSTNVSSSSSASSSISASPSGTTSGSVSPSSTQSPSSSQSSSPSPSGEDFVDPGVQVTRLTDNSFTVHKSGFPVIKKGDVFVIAESNVPENDNEREMDNLRPYVVDTVVTVGNLLKITTIDVIYKSGTGMTTEEKFETDDFIQIWSPKVETEIVADFRAVRAEEHGVTHRITSLKDIFDAWVNPLETSIDPRNELAFMMSIIFSRSGGKVCYGHNVDSTASNKAAEYAAALEDLKLFDVYSHAFGTTDAGVNGIIGDYCDEQADPYEGHERIGLICYDLEDLYLMGTDSGSINEDTGVITTTGACDLIAAGVTMNDKVEIFGDDGLIYTATILETPVAPEIPGNPFTVVTDFRNDTAVSSPTFKFQSGRKDDQAVRAGNIKYGNRRVGMVFPGWFYAEFNGERMSLPPYFITATIAGMDSGIIASQSFTNMPFSIPGLTNIELNTSTYFRKAQLDQIGGGGVDIMIQDATVTPAIKSRHDLTTNMDAVQLRERSITKQADVAAKTIRSALSPYVGRYNINDSNLFRFLGQVCAIVCGKLVKDGILSKLVVTKIARDEVIDDKVNFFLEATAYIAGNYYDVTLLVKTR